MAKVGNRVKETTDTTGTGTLDLNGSATGFRSFLDEFTTGDEVYYLIVDDPDSPTDYEYGIGTITAGTPDTLSRDTVEGSSNSGNKVSWAAGTKTVICTPLASQLNEPATVEKIASGTVTNEATLDLTGLSNAYSHYELVFDDLVPVSDNVGLWLRTDSDGGASFDAGASDYAYAWLTATEAGAVAGSGSSGDTKIQVLANAGNGAAEQASGRITIYNPGKGGQRPKVSWEISYRDQANVFRRSTGGGERTSAAAAIDAIRILFSSGNIDTMNYTLYGYRA